MKKHSLFLIGILIFMFLFQAGCTKNEQTNTTDWGQIIRMDFLAGESTVEKAIMEAVSIKVKQDDDRLIVTVEAPDICDELLNWMELISDEDFTQAAMEAKILQLLKESKKIEADYVLLCSGEGDTAQIAYTPEFGDAMTCGLTRFYAEVTQRIVEDMEDDAG
jgi:hypothetical protein